MVGRGFWSYQLYRAAQRLASECWGCALSERRVLEERFWRTSKLLRVTVERVGDLGSKFSAALTRSLNRASRLEPGSVYEAMLQLVRSY